MKTKPHIVLIVTGSVAVCKVPQLLGVLSDSYTIDVIATKAPEQWQHKPRWIPIEKIRAATKGLVLTHGDPILSKKECLQRANIILVAPATADFLSQLAYKSSDLACLLMEAHDAGVVIYAAPAMNYKIWEHPTVQRNCATLAARGVRILGPVEGVMACNDFGFGRMMSVDAIASFVHEGNAEGAAASYEAAKTAAKDKRTERGAPGLPLLAVLMGDQTEWAEIEAFFAEIRKDNLSVKVVLDQKGKKFAKPLEKVLQDTVITDHYQVDREGLEHIRLPQQARAVVFPFVDAMLAAQMIAGSSRTLGMDIYLASKAPVAIIPSKRAPPDKAALLALGKDGINIHENLSALMKEKSLI